jgi:prepilin-type processing-associated H-X9-DG protein
MVDVAGGNGSATPTSPSDWVANGVFFNKFNAYAIANPPATGNPPTLPTWPPATGGGWTGVIQAAQSNNGGPINSISQDYITTHDGTSLTLMMSENNNGILVNMNGGAYSNPSFSNSAGSWGNVSPGNSSLPYSGLETTQCFVWWPDINPSADMKINAPLPATGTTPNYYHYMHPASNHPTAVNVAFCDGHARNISQDIDYLVFSLMMTPWGQQCNTPGTTGGLDGAGGTAPAGELNRDCPTFEF